MRAKARQLMRTLFLLLVLPVYLTYLVLAGLTRPEPAFQGVSQFMALVPGALGAHLRGAFYALTMRHCSRRCRIEFMTTFVTPKTIIGEHVYIGSHCNIALADIGPDCLLGSGVHIMSGKGQHRFDDPEKPIRLQGGKRERVIIGRDCWLGNGSLIMADVGEGSVVAAGSVVVKPVEPFSIVAGNPAKKIGERGKGDE